MTTVRELISKVRFVLDKSSLRKVETSFNTIKETAKKTNSSVKNSFKGLFKPMSEEMLEMSRQMTDMGRTLTTRLTLPIVAFGGFALRAASQFDEAMNRVNAVTGATDAQFEQLNNKAKELGATTAFSASEVAQGMGFLAQAGLEVNQVLDAINPALQLAAAGQLSLAEASDISTNVMTQYRLSTEELNMVNDVLAKTATSTNTNVRELGDGFAYAGGVAKAAGLSVAQTSQYLGAMANVGVKGSRAGTALASSLSRLQQAASGVGRMAKVTNENFEAFGITITDFQTSTGEIDLTALLKKLNEFSHRSDFAGRIMRIFGEEAGRTFISLAKAPDILDDVINKTSDFNGAASEMQEKMMRGLPGAMKVLKSTFEALQIAFIDAIKPVLIPLIEGLSGLFSAFTKLQPETQRFVGILALLAAALGPVLLAIGFFAPMVGKMIAALKLARMALVSFNLTALAMPILIIAAIAAVLLAFDDLAVFIKGQPSIFGEMLRQSGADVPKVRAIITTVWEDFKWLFSSIKEGWKNIFSGELFDSLNKFVEGVQIRLANMLPSGLAKMLGLGDYKFPSASFSAPTADSVGGGINFGGSAPVSVSPTVNVNVSNTNASPEQIGREVQKAIEPNLQRTARQLRQNNENVYEN